MKKRVLIGIALLMGITLFTGCGSGKTSEKSNVEESGQSANTVANTTETETERETESETESEAQTSESWLAMFGNNPNNLYQADGRMAFDDEYIYYSTDDGIYRMTYDGSEAAQLSDQDCEFLNVYDGCLYYGRAERVDDNNTLYICSMNLDTFEETILVTRSTGSKWDKLELSSILVVNGYLFFAYDDDGNDLTKVETMDISSQSGYISCSLSDAGDLYPWLTASATGMVYAFMNDGGVYSNERAVYQLALADIPDYGRFKQVTDARKFGYYHTMMILSDGVYRLYSDNSYYYLGMDDVEYSEVQYYKASFSKIDAEDLRWGYMSDESKIGPDLSLMDADAANLVYLSSGTFLLNNTMYIMETDYGDGETVINVYRYTAFDFENGELVYTETFLHYSEDSLVYGIGKDAMYIVQISEENGEPTLTRIEQAS